MVENELNCKELVELITEYLEGTLSPTERTRFEAHLLGCSGCHAYVEQMRQTIHALGCLTEEHVAPPARDELLQLFRDWKKR